MSAFGIICLAVSSTLLICGTILDAANRIASAIRESKRD